MNEQVCKRLVTRNRRRVRCGNPIVACVSIGDHPPWHACVQCAADVICRRMSRYDSACPPRFPLRVEFLGTLVQSLGEDSESRTEVRTM